MTEEKSGFLQVGVDPILREVVINFDRDRTGHVTFSPQQARQLAALLMEKADDLDRSDMIPCDACHAAKIAGIECVACGGTGFVRQ